MTVKDFVTNNEAHKLRKQMNDASVTFILQLHCSEEVVSSKPVLTRNVMKPCTTTPSGDQLSHCPGFKVLPKQYNLNVHLCHLSEAVEPRAQTVKLIQ